MAKAPGESRIPTFGSRIPIPGKFRFLPNLTLRTPPTNLKQDTNKTCMLISDVGLSNDKATPEIDRTITVSPANSETMSPPTQRKCNKTILIQKTGSENSDPNCTVTLDANSAEATFVMKCIKREKNQSPAQPTASSGITAQDIGKRVCVGNAQSGKLKYVGEVRFNTGLWCGVELDDAVGKHDGCVKGVRYFTCSADCGILAPINKVNLLLDNKPTCDTTYNKVTVDDRGDSGPYSLLEVEDVRVNSNDALKCDDDELNKTLVLNEEQVEQDLVSNINPVPAFSVKNDRWSLISGNIISNDKNNVDMSTTYTPPSDNSFNCAGASTPIGERRREVKTKNPDSSSESTFTPNKLNVTVVKALELNKTVNITPVHTPNDIPSLTKQNSFEFDESLGILTPDQMVDFSSFMKNTGSASSDDLKSILAKHNEKITLTSRTPSSENVGSVSKDCFKIPLASVPMSSKNSAIRDQKFSFDTVKLPSSEDLKSLIYSNQNVLTHSTRTEILNTVDESLGILTSDQMVDFSTFVHNSGTIFSDDLKLILAKHNERLSLSSRKLPSSEDLKSLISNQNITTRTQRQNTFSRTPSSENLCSEVKFSTNSFTCDSSKMCDESSLMILTPEQMEISVFDASKTPSSENLKSILCSHRSDKTISNSRTPSSENVGSLPHDVFKQPLPVEPLEIKEESLSLSRPCSIDLRSSSDPIKSMKISASHQADVSSPNAVENSMIDFSLGLLEEDMLATGNQFSSMIDTTTNLELPLDSVSGDKIERFKSLSRSDQTPSPEDLPLDPIDPIKPVEMDIIEPNLLHPSSDSDPKTDVSKSTTTTKTNSFITSVTSITSLDTGYQGDGEMSRPASRGADHSPMAHKPNNPALVNLQWQRAIARRQDPMTDSDFFTESDADIHEENVPRGDRRAQVIDGNLYGPNAQAPAAQDIFIGNQEEMDSSGIFTDLDMNRPDDFSDGERNRIDVIIVNEDKSPSEISTKSITENSQELKEPEDLESTLVNEAQDTSIMEVTESISDKPKSPTQSVISNSSRKNVRTRTDQSKEENPSKKLKMPKRNVTSKVKTMMEQKQDIENQENRKPKATRKPTGRWDAVMNKISQGKDENKSKIRLKEVKSKVSTGISGTPITKREIQKTDTNTFTKPKIRRIRARGEALAATKSNTQASSSVHSSLSDLSISQLSHNNNKPSISSVSPEIRTTGISSIRSLAKQDTEHPDDNVDVDRERRRAPRPPRKRVSKKRETVGRCTPPVTEVLTPGGHKPTPVTSSRTTTITSSRTREFEENCNESRVELKDILKHEDNCNKSHVELKSILKHNPETDNNVQVENEFHGELKSILKHNPETDNNVQEKCNEKHSRRRRRTHRMNLNNNVIYVLNSTNVGNYPSSSSTSSSSDRKKLDYSSTSSSSDRKKSDYSLLVNEIKERIQSSRIILKKQKDKFLKDRDTKHKRSFLSILKKNFDCGVNSNSGSDIIVESKSRNIQQRIETKDEMENTSLESDVGEENIETETKDYHKIYFNNNEVNDKDNLQTRSYHKMKYSNKEINDVDNIQTRVYRKTKYNNKINDDNSVYENRNRDNNIAFRSILKNTNSPINNNEVVRVRDILKKEVDDNMDDISEDSDVVSENDSENNFEHTNSCENIRRINTNKNFNNKVEHVALDFDISMKNNFVKARNKDKANSMHNNFEGNDTEIRSRIIMNKNMNDNMHDSSVDSDTDIVNYSKNNFEDNYNNLINSDTSFKQTNENNITNILSNRFDNDDNISTDSDTVVDNNKSFLLDKSDENDNTFDCENYSNSLKSILKNKFDNVDSISADSDSNTISSKGNNSLKSILKNKFENCDTVSTDSNNDPVFENRYNDVVDVISRTVLKRHSEHKVRFCLGCDSSVTRCKSSYVPGRSILKKNSCKSNTCGESCTTFKNRKNEKHVCSIYKNNIFNDDISSYKNGKPKFRSSSIPRRVFWFGSPDINKNSNSDNVDNKVVQSKIPRRKSCHKSGDSSDDESVVKDVKNNKVRGTAKKKSSKNNFSSNKSSTSNVVAMENKIVENNLKTNRVSRNFSKKKFNSCNDLEKDTNRDYRTEEIKNKGLDNNSKVVNKLSRNSSNKNLNNNFKNCNNSISRIINKIKSKSEVISNNLKTNGVNINSSKKSFDNDNNSENNINGDIKSDTKAVVRIKHTKTSRVRRNISRKYFNNSENSSDNESDKIKSKAIYNKSNKGSKNSSRNNVDTNVTNDSSDAKTAVDGKNKVVCQKNPERETNDKRKISRKRSSVKTSREKETMAKKKNNIEEVGTINEISNKYLLRSVRRMILSNDKTTAENRNVNSESKSRERNIVTRVPRRKMYSNRNPPDQNFDKDKTSPDSNSIVLKNKEVKAVSNNPRVIYDRDRFSLRSPESGLNRISHWSAQGLRITSPNVTNVSSPLRLRIPVSARNPVRPRPTEIPQLLKKSPPAAPIDRRAASRRPGATLPAKVPSATSASAATRDQSRVTGVTPQKGGSPLRTQPLPEKPPAAVQATHLLPHVKHSAKGVEALGVLVQYLVFNLDAFRTPSLKRELEHIRTQWIKDKLELEETRMGYRRLEDAVSEQKILAAQTIEEERIKFRAEITELFEKQRRDVAELNERNKQELIELEQRLAEDNNELRNQLDLEISNRENEISIRIEAYVSEHRYRLLELEKENERLRRNNQSAVEILREENEAIREQLDEKTSMIEDLKELKYINNKLKEEFTLKERKFEEKLITAQDEVALLKEENKKILETFKSDTKDNKLQAALGRCTQLQDEVESLRTVLDLKLAELSELRRAHGELSQAAEELPAALIRAQSLQARVEDLELQLERKTDVELQLTKDNKRLQESLSQESKQNKRLTLHNEELQWKLKQNSEVVNAILQGQTPNRKSLHGSNQSLCDDLSYKTPAGSFMNRTHHTSSFNEKHHGTSHILERTLSFRERTSHFMKDTPNRIPESQSPTPNERFHCNFDLDDSPPSSPKVKGVVEKSDSVSWVLDMDESPEVIASRMVRRAGSFRNVTPPKSTPTKSPASKRPRTKVNNLSLSASAGAIVSPDDKNDNRYRSKSVSLRDSHSQSPEICHPGDYLSNSWHYSLRTSTPIKSGLETIRSTVKLENNPDLEHDSDVAITLPALPSEISRKKVKDNCSKPDSLPSLPSGDLLLLQSSFPKNSAGEAMISESNSEDECSSSTSERSPSASDTETSEERTGGSGDKCVPKSKLQYDLFLLTESATNSEAMDCSWSEDLEV